MRTTAALVVLLAAAAEAATPARVTQADLLRRLIDLDRLMTPPTGERTGLFSSFERRWPPGPADRGVGKQPPATADDGWQVLAEMDGPGAIVRIWSANPTGRIRFVLDGQAVIDAPFAHLFNGQLPPFDEPLCHVTPGGGHNCYFPLGYNRSCRVLVRYGTPAYQINYVQFPRGTQVETFQPPRGPATQPAVRYGPDQRELRIPPLDPQAQAVYAEVAHALRYGLSERQLFGDRPAPPVGAYEPLERGGKLAVETHRGGGVIRALYVGVADRIMPAEPYALHRCILRIHCDGEPQPRVEVPLTDFFGAGFEPAFFNSLVLGTDKYTTMQGESLNETRFMYCYFPMPFQDAARIEIENLSGRKIGLTVWAKVERTPPPADRLRFFARFRKEDPCQGQDYPILETTGRGRIVGCTLNVDCPRRAWWGAGHEQLWIDGETSPSYRGTGSADYLGDAGGLWLHADAFHGATRTGPYGKVSGYRWHVSDCINFHKSVRFTIGNRQADDARDTYYGSVVYWYGEPGARHFFRPLTLADVTPPGLRIPGAVEVEGHVLDQMREINPLSEKYADGAELSGRQAVSIGTTEPVRIAIPSEAARIVRLRLRVNPKRPFQTIEVSDAAGRLIGAARYDRRFDGTYTVGVIALHAGDNVVTVRCRPRGILDCWILEDVPKSPRGPEGEDLEPLATTSAATRIEVGDHPWSGGAQRVIDFAAAGDTVQFELPAVRKDGPRGLYLVVTHGPAGGRFQTLLDDRPLGEPFDTYAPEVGPARVALGAVPLKAGRHRLAFRAAAPDSRASGRQLGLDVVELVDVISPWAVECEDLPHTSATDANPQVWAWAGASGGACVHCRAAGPGAWVEFDLPVRQAGKYRLAIVCTTSFDHAIVQTYVNGRKAGEPFDTFGEPQPGPVRPLGQFDLPAGPLRLRVEVAGRNEQSAAHFFSVDCLLLEPVGSQPAAAP